MLHRYWLTFVRSEEPSFLNIGCGITAYSIEDAKQIFEEEVAPLAGSRQIVGIVEDIAISDLDEGHVRPNIGIPSNRGVWFPAL